VRSCPGWRKGSKTKLWPDRPHRVSALVGRRHPRPLDIGAVGARLETAAGNRGGLAVAREVEALRRLLRGRVSRALFLPPLPFPAYYSMPCSSRVWRNLGTACVEAGLNPGEPHMNRHPSRLSSPRSSDPATSCNGATSSALLAQVCTNGERRWHQALASDFFQNPMTGLAHA